MESQRGISECVKAPVLIFTPIWAPESGLAELQRVQQQKFSFHYYSVCVFVFGSEAKEVHKLWESNSQCWSVIKVLQWHRISVGSPQDGRLIPSMKRTETVRGGWERERDGGSVKKRGEKRWRSFPQQIPLSHRVERAPFLNPTPFLLLLLSPPPLSSFPPPLTNNAKTWQPTRHMSNSFPSGRGSHPTALAPAMSEEWRAL